MIVQISPERTLNKIGASIAKPIILPPDKSIFHRLLIIGSLSNSKIRIPITSIEEIPIDIYATILALQSLAVPIEISRSEIELQGVGIRGLHEPKHKINCANSGTTARLLMGLLAGQEFTSVLTGDASLAERPMKRLADIFNSELGADIQTAVEGKMPVAIHGRELHSGNILLPVASAQMKSAVLLAGLNTIGEVSATEPLQSRDHTERMLVAFGEGVKQNERKTSVSSYRFTTPNEFTYHAPGDISSAAFLIGAAILVRKSIILHKVGLNPTRKKFLDILHKSGLEIEISNRKEVWNEESDTIEIFASETSILRPFVISDEDIPLIGDEIPLLAVLSSFCKGETNFNNVGELRHKETDRLNAIIKNLRSCGVLVEEREDGFIVFGDETFIPYSNSVEHYGDHRIAMAFAIMALRAKENVTVSDASVVSISYPNFFKDLAIVAGSGRIRIS